MSSLRAALRLLGVLLATLTLFVCWLIPLALRPFSGRAATHIRARLMRLWARFVLLVLGVRVAVVGAPPARPFLLVSNHLSYLDVLVLWSAVECNFLARGDLARWPVLGPLTRLAGTLYVDRTRRAAVAPALDAVRARLARGEGIVVFPEGTSSPGATVLPFRSSLFAAAAAAGGRAWVAAISYNTRDAGAPAHLRVAWWGDMSFSGHFWRLLQLRRIQARLAFGARPLAGAERKALAAATHAACLQIFTPTLPSPAA